MTISADQVVAPSPAVAERSLEIFEGLATDLRADPHRMEVEAMAMHNASLSALRGAFGPAYVRRMLDFAYGENERVASRDRVITEGRRSLEARARSL